MMEPVTALYRVINKINTCISLFNSIQRETEQGGYDDSGLCWALQAYHECLEYVVDAVELDLDVGRKQYPHDSIKDARELLKKAQERRERLNGTR